MTDCKICGMIESGELKKVYEDEKIVAVLSNEPVSVGHILVIPKKHYAIIEQIPDYEVGYIFSVTNKISISLF